MESELSPAEGQPPRLIVVSGLSGAGKSVVLDTLEDLDCYCVDNLPAGLLQAFATQTLLEQASRYPLVAVGIDARNRPEDVARLPRVLSALATCGVGWRVWFLAASDAALIKRFSESRRPHPLALDGGTRLTAAIAHERALLAEVARLADWTLDTSETNVHQLRRLVVDAMQARRRATTLLFESFAFRHGVPVEADYVFDARGLPNPHWVPALRPLTGRDGPVREFLEAQAPVRAYLDDLASFLERWLDHDEAPRSYLTVTIGCSGGRHRSVYLAEALAERFRGVRDFVLCHHRELS